MAKPRILIAVPEDDISIELFSPKICKSRMDITVCSYEQSPTAAKENWDFIYIRGPFVKSDFDRHEIKESINKTLRLASSAYSVDNIHSFSDLLLEDKWRQYELLADLMPATQLVESFGGIDLKNNLIKKRISGRSRDIHFNMSELSSQAMPKDYIVQECLPIQTEYRAFMVGGEIILPLEIKSGKTESTKNQVMGMEIRLPTELNKICQKVFSRLGFDFAGLDIARSGEKFYLIEVNRSPQFLNFRHINKINLAETLFAYLLEKSH